MANSRIGIPTNLPSGGKFDLNILDFGIQPFPVGQISFDFGTTPTKTTGIQKLAQIYLKCLFTAKGSVPVHQSYGTGFPQFMVGANRPYQTQTQAVAYVKEFLQDAQSQVISLTTGNDPATTLQSVTLQGLTLVADGINLGLYLLSTAGQGASIAIPAPQLNTVTV